MEHTGLLAAPPGAGFADISRLADSYSCAQALLSALELDLFTVLDTGPASEKEIRSALGLHGRGLRQWLDLLVPLGLLERDGDRYGNTPQAALHLARSGRQYLGDFILKAMVPSLGNLSTALRTGQSQVPGGGMAAVADDPALLRSSMAAMDMLTGDIVPSLLAAYEDWDDHRTLLDLGGGRGSVAAGLVAARPHLDAVVLDLPFMAPLFEETMAARGAAKVPAFRPGDFFTDPLPRADIVLLGNVLLDWEAEQRRSLVRRAYLSTNPGGALIVYDHRLRGAGPGGRETLTLNLLTLAMCGVSDYTLDELHADARAAGYDAVEHRSPGSPPRPVVVCRRSARPV
ncbi:acetylserotonin O-methyltransferase [Streptomyces marincola]|uniref:acetylserotonin O-methyltransferase n=1 Tax=Streptomyces marincola TaxID=2878388 RepID=UPI001CF5430A|nr:acetylserotonin O-methyltransferase [Streptomyces marincola]UCM86577.1 acetylserotonin O-methyltransferase [Streptomyces marincola]